MFIPQQLSDVRRPRSGPTVSMLLCILLSICGLLAACKTADQTLEFGAYEFPATDPQAALERGRPFSDLLSAGPEVFAEWFIDQPAEKVLRDISWVRLYQAEVYDSVLTGERSFDSDNLKASYRLSELEEWGEEVSRNVLSGDPAANELVVRIFKHLLDGINGGRWRMDPNLAAVPATGENQNYEVRPLCSLVGGLFQGEQWEFDRSGFDRGPAWKMNLAVYYTFEGASTETYTDLQGVERRRENDAGIAIPNVFLFANRSTSHIFVLGREDGIRVHRAILALHKRVDELFKERQPVIKIDEILVARVRPLADGEFLDYGSSLTDWNPGAYNFRYPYTSFDWTWPEVRWRVLDDGTRELYLPEQKFSPRTLYMGQQFRVSISKIDADGRWKVVRQESTWIRYKQLADEDYTEGPWIDLSRK